MLSIHAPTRGATAMGYYINKINNLSIHAPTRGATPIYLGMSISQHFQSTLLQEERQG